jgi:hypothetical protein
METTTIIGLLLILLGLILGTFLLAHDLKRQDEFEEMAYQINDRLHEEKRKNWKLEEENKYLKQHLNTYQEYIIEMGGTRTNLVTGDGEADPNGVNDAAADNLYPY